MRPIDHHIQFMTPHTQDRIRNTITPHNLMLDPMIKNDPQVMNDFRIHIPGCQQPSLLTHSTPATHSNQNNYKQHQYTSANDLTSGDSLSTLLIVFAVTITLVFASILVCTTMPYLTQYIEITTIVINEFAVWSLKQIQIINNVPSVLAIAAIVHTIIRNQYRKQLSTIQRRVEIMDRYIDENIQHNNESQKVTQQASEAAPAPVVEKIGVQAAQNQDIDFTNPNSCGVVVIDSIDGIPYEHVDGERLESTLALIKENWGWEADKKLGYNKTARRLVETGVGYK